MPADKVDMEEREISFDIINWRASPSPLQRVWCRGVR